MDRTSENQSDKKIFIPTVDHGTANSSTQNQPFQSHRTSPNTEPTPNDIPKTNHPIRHQIKNIKPDSIEGPLTFNNNTYFTDHIAMPHYIRNNPNISKKGSESILTCIKDKLLNCHFNTNTGNHQLLQNTPENNRAASTYVSFSGSLKPNIQMRNNSASTTYTRNSNENTINDLSRPISDSYKYPLKYLNESNSPNLILHNMQNYTHTDINTSPSGAINTNLSGAINIPTPRDTSTFPYDALNLPPPRDIPQRTPRDINAYTPRDINPRTPRDINPRTPRDINAYTPRDINAYTPRDINAYTPRDINAYTPRNNNKSNQLTNFGKYQTDNKQLAAQGKTKNIKYDTIINRNIYPFHAPNQTSYDSTPIKSPQIPEYTQIPSPAVGPINASCMNLCAGTIFDCNSNENQDDQTPYLHNSLIGIGDKICDLVNGLWKTIEKPSNEQNVAPNFIFFSTEHQTYYLARPYDPAIGIPDHEWNTALPLERRTLLNRLIDIFGWIAVYVGMIGIAGTCAATQLCQTAINHINYEKEIEIIVDEKTKNEQEGVRPEFK